MKASRWAQGDAGMVVEAVACSKRDWIACGRRAPCCCVR